VRGADIFHHALEAFDVFHVDLALSPLCVDDNSLAVVGFAFLLERRSVA